MSDFLILALLFLLVALSFYAGYAFTVKQSIENTLTVLKEDGIIRMVEGDDGEIEIYSGYKFYQGKSEKS